MTLQTEFLLIQGKYIPCVLTHVDNNPLSTAFGTSTFHIEYNDSDEFDYDRALYFLYKDYFMFLATKTYISGVDITFVNKIPGLDGLFLLLYLTRFLRIETDSIIRELNKPHVNMPKILRRIKMKGLTLDAFYLSIRLLHSPRLGILFRDIRVVTDVKNLLLMKYSENTDKNFILENLLAVRVACRNLENELSFIK